MDFLQCAFCFKVHIFDSFTPDEGIGTNGGQIFSDCDFSNRRLSAFIRKIQIPRSLTRIRKIRHCTASGDNKRIGGSRLITVVFLQIGSDIVSLTLSGNIPRIFLCTLFSCIFQQFHRVERHNHGIDGFIVLHIKVVFLGIGVDLGDLVADPLHLLLVLRVNISRVRQSCDQCRKLFLRRGAGRFSLFTRRLLLLISRSLIGTGGIVRRADGAVRVHGLPGTKGLADAGRLFRPGRLLHRRLTVDLSRLLCDHGRSHILRSLRRQRAHRHQR